MKQNFNDCLNRVLKDEGGYSNDPSDSGGATNLGITQKETAKDVRTLTIDDARNIYKSKYWDALDCDNLPSGVDYTVFDYGVNSGLGRPRKALQQFKSLQGTKLIDAINNERTAFLEALAARRKKDQKFLHGWLSRVERVRVYSKKLAGGSNIAGPVAGTATVGAGAAISQYFHNHEAAILIGAIIAAIAVGTALHMYINRKSNG